jgi:hypothetical protein
MKKYAVDLLNTDKFIPKHDSRVVEINIIEEVSDDKINIVGFYEDDGEGFERVLDHDSVVTVL